MSRPPMPWWERESEDDKYQEARRQFIDYVNSDSPRLSALNVYRSVYANRHLTGSQYLPGWANKIMGSGGSHYSRMPINVAKIMIDAAHARVTRSAIQIKFLTETHNYTNRKGARQMERYIDFQDHQCGGLTKYDRATLDGFVDGTGCVATDMHPKIDDVEIDVVRTLDVFIDPTQAAISDNPRDMFRRKYVDRSTLKALFPEKAKEIQDAGVITPEGPAKPPQKTAVDDRRTVCEVVCGWRLPSFDGAGDGHFIIFVDGAVLDIGEWELNDFPLTFTRWKEDKDGGFWGVGLLEELLGQHWDINNSFYHTFRAVELMPKPVGYFPAGAKVTDGSIGNIPGLRVDYVDGKPSIELPMSVPTDIQNLIMFQWGKALETARLAAMGMPESTGSGFETGQAIRDFNDIQSTELAPNFKEYQEFRIRCGEQLVTGGKRVADRAKDEGRRYKVVMAKDKYTIEEIDWDNISLDPRRDSYVIKALPASALSQTFAGKKADVIDLLNAQLIDRETALSLLDFPDLQDFFNMVMGQRKAIEREIELILDDNEVIPFDPNNSLRLGLKMYQEAIAKAQAMDIPQDRIQRLRDQVEVINQYIREEQMVTQNMAAGVPVGLPGSPPALDLNGASPQANAEGLIQ